MSIDFNFSANILEKEYILKELSFLNYRTLVKSLLDSNEKNINLAFNNLLQFSCVNIKPVNSIEKFLILLKIRSVCVNESIQITTDNIRLNLYVNDIFSKINTPYKYFEYEVDDYNGGTEIEKVNVFCVDFYPYTAYEIETNNEHGDYK